MANEPAPADHLRTIVDILDEALKPIREAEIRAAEERFGRHVVALLGQEKPWASFGATAIQWFRPGFSCVYFIGGDEGAIKIGLSTAPLERLAAMQMGSPIRLSILALIEGCAQIEKEYHRRFAEHRSHGEWFHRHPDILAEIDRLTAGAA